MSFENNPETDKQPLMEAAPFKVGVAVNTHSINGLNGNPEAYNEVILTEINSITRKWQLK